MWSDPGSRPGHRCSALVLFERIARGPSQREPRPCETKWEPPPIENKQVGHVAVGQTALREPTPLSRRLAAVSPRRTCEDGLAGLYSSLGSAGGGAEESNKGHGGRGASGMLQGQLDGLGALRRGHTTYILKSKVTEAVLVMEDPLARVVRRVGNWHHVGGSTLPGLVLFRPMDGMEMASESRLPRRVFFVWPEIWALDQITNIYPFLGVVRKPNNGYSSCHVAPCPTVPISSLILCSLLLTMPPLFTYGYTSVHPTIDSRISNRPSMLRAQEQAPK